MKEMFQYQMILFLSGEVVKGEKSFNYFMDYLVYTNVTIYHMETRGLVFVYYTTSNNNNYFLMHIHFFRDDRNNGNNSNTYKFNSFIYCKNEKIIF